MVFPVAEEPQAEELQVDVPQVQETPKYPVGTKAFSSEINDDLLCPSQVYEYVEVIDDNGTVQYVGYDEKDTYEQQEDDKTLSMLFGEPVEESTMTFDEQRASMMFVR